MYMELVYKYKSSVLYRTTDKDLNFGAMPFSRGTQLLFVADSRTETGGSPGMIKDC